MKNRISQLGLAAGLLAAGSGNLAAGCANPVCKDDGTFEIGTGNSGIGNQFPSDANFSDDPKVIGGCDWANLAKNGFDPRKVGEDAFNAQLKGSFDIDPQSVPKVKTMERGEVKDFTVDQIRENYKIVLNRGLAKFGLEVKGPSGESGDSDLPLKVVYPFEFNNGTNIVKDGVSISTSYDCADWNNVFKPLNVNIENKQACSNQKPKEVDDNFDGVWWSNTTGIDQSKSIRVLGSFDNFDSLGDDRKYGNRPGRVEFVIDDFPTREIDIYGYQVINDTVRKGRLNLFTVFERSGATSSIRDSNFSPEGLELVQDGEQVNFCTTTDCESTKKTIFDFKDLVELMKTTPNEQFVNQLLTYFSQRHYKGKKLDFSELESRDQLGEVYSLLAKRDPVAFVSLVMASFEIELNFDIGMVFKKMHEKADVLEIFRSGKADQIDLIYLVIDWCYANSVEPKIKIKIPVIDGKKDFGSMDVYIYFPFDEGRTALIRALQSGTDLSFLGEVMDGELQADSQDELTIFDGTLDELRNKGASIAN